MDRANEIVAVYADGGVILKNPSSIGGTWAFCAVDVAGNHVIEQGGVVIGSNERPITNNITEQIAIVKALEAMPDGWSGTVYSDSQIALGRVFKGWRGKNLPSNVIERTQKAIKRMGRIKPVLLKGHPTQKQLKEGFAHKGRRTTPVSIHNVWCDKACTEQARNYMAQLPEKVEQ